MKLFYSSKYDIKFYGVERIHPFDSRKYSKAWRLLERRFGSQLQKISTEPNGPASDSDLLKAHTKLYINLLQSKNVVSQALELPLLRYLPYCAIDHAIITPMRWATAGTIAASRHAACNNTTAVNLSGGYHHASQQHGEGFCLFSDVGIAVAILRQDGILNAGDCVAIIDLDAHQGNGFERIFMDDDAVVIFDMYNADIYPRDTVAKNRINVDVPLASGTSDEQYLNLLKKNLPPFLDRASNARLVFYNAGTDILAGDKLGGLNVSRQNVLARDIYVFTQLIERRLPFVMLLSGGYTRQSYEIVADSITKLLTMTNIEMQS